MPYCTYMDESLISNSITLVHKIKANENVYNLRAITLRNSYQRSIQYVQVLENKVSKTLESFNHFRMEIISFSSSIIANETEVTSHTCFTLLLSKISAIKFSGCFGNDKALTKSIIHFSSLLRKKILAKTLFIKTCTLYVQNYANQSMGLIPVIL